MIDIINKFFNTIYVLITNLFTGIKTFFETIILVPTVAPWLINIIPSVFIGLASLGVAFVVVKIIKDLL